MLDHDIARKCCVVQSSCLDQNGAASASSQQRQSLLIPPQHTRHAPPPSPLSPPLLQATRPRGKLAAALGDGIERARAQVAGSAELGRCRRRVDAQPRERRAVAVTLSLLLLVVVVKTAVVMLVGVGGAEQRGAAALGGAAADAHLGGARRARRCGDALRPTGS